MRSNIGRPRSSMHDSTCNVRRPPSRIERPHPTRTERPTLTRASSAPTLRAPSAPHLHAYRALILRAPSAPPIAARRPTAPQPTTATANSATTNNYSKHPTAARTERPSYPTGLLTYSTRSRPRDPKRTASKARDARALPMRSLERTASDAHHLSQQCSMRALQRVSATCTCATSASEAPLHPRGSILRAPSAPQLAPLNTRSRTAHARNRARSKRADRHSSACDRIGRCSARVGRHSECTGRHGAYTAGGAHELCAYVLHGRASSAARRTLSKLLIGRRRGRTGRHSACLHQHTHTHRTVCTSPHVNVLHVPRASNVTCQCKTRTPPPATHHRASNATYGQQRHPRATANSNTQQRHRRPTAPTNTTSAPPTRTGRPILHAPSGPHLHAHRALNHQRSTGHNRGKWTAPTVAPTAREARRRGGRGTRATTRRGHLRARPSSFGAGVATPGAHTQPEAAEGPHGRDPGPTSPTREAARTKEEKRPSKVRASHEQAQMPDEAIIPQPAASPRGPNGVPRSRRDADR